MDRFKRKTSMRRRRHRRVRRRVVGSTERPRLCVYRSLKNIYCQVIDDAAGRVLVAASTMMPVVREQVEKGGTTQAAAVVGKAIGEAARQKGIEQVRFDRGGYKYHGRVKALAEAAREAGLKF